MRNERTTDASRYGTGAGAPFHIYSNDRIQGASPLGTVRERFDRTHEAGLQVPTQNASSVEGGRYSRTLPLRP